MKDINITVVVTSDCNLCCKYCINDSGDQLKDTDANELGLVDAEEIVRCLHKISTIRNIRFIKFFGGEPLLKYDMIHQIVVAKEKYAPEDDKIRFAFTTNGCSPVTDEMLEFFKTNRFIVNLSLDGPENINNSYRIPKDGKTNVFNKVLDLAKRLKDKSIPYAFISVLDERVIDYNYSISELAEFIEGHTKYYKIEPSYTIIENRQHNMNPNKKKTLHCLLEQEREFINRVFRGIFSLKQENFIYENNVLRTMSNIVYNQTKDYVCSAAGMLAILPGKSAYACYNLINGKYLITKDINNLESKELDERLTELKTELQINRFPKEYKEIEYYGDYCPKENNFDSFAYMYRKVMVETIKEKLQEIKPGSKEHLALLGYLATGYGGAYYENLA